MNSRNPKSNEIFSAFWNYRDWLKIMSASNHLPPSWINYRQAKNKTEGESLEIVDTGKINKIVLATCWRRLQWGRFAHLEFLQQIKMCSKMIRSKIYSIWLHKHLILATKYRAKSPKFVLEERSKPLKISTLFFVVLFFEEFFKTYQIEHFFVCKAKKKNIWEDEKIKHGMKWLRLCGKK